MSDSAALEANRSFTQAWEFWSRRSRSGEVSRFSGLTAAWMNVTWPACNLTFLSEPVRDEADLESRARAALEHASGRDRGWVFFVCTELLPEDLRPSSLEILSRCGLNQAVELTGMAADRLLPPRRPLPDLDLRRVGDRDTRRAFGEINAAAYGMPVEWGHEALDVEALWGSEAFGVVGYLDGKPVTTSETIALDGILYVALVATLPEHQKKGYAEVAMRHSLTLASAATGFEKTILQASQEGLRLYQEMGYRATSQFPGVVP